MKPNIIVLFSCLIFFQCKDTQNIKTSDIDSKNSSVEKENVTTQANQVVGGFSPMEVTPLITELASYVLSEKNITSPIKEITNLSSQVVSGKNYKFDMLLEDGKKYMTKVYVNLKGEKEITEFKLVP